MKDNFRMALQAILANKVRSLLTMLGIIVGIGAVIVIFSIINGNTENMKRQLVGGDTNSIRIEYGPRASFLSSDAKKEKEEKPDYTPEINKKKMEQIRVIPGVADVSVLYESHYYTFVKEQQFASDVLAIDSHFFQILPYRLLQGRKFLREEYATATQICLVTQELARTSLKNENPIGQFIEISGVAFRIVGVVQPDFDEKGENHLFIPLKMADMVGKKFNQKPLILLKGTDTNELEQTARIAAIRLTELIPPSNYVFSIKNSEEIKRTTREVNQSNMILLGSIASISLLVGGIGVMNTMLVSVTERTQEIGLKKALGANRNIILQQFLLESMVLTSLGGLMGIFFGLVIGLGATKILNYPFVFSPFALFISTIFSIGLGMVFGLAPAYRAAKLNPIDALRHE